MQRVEALSVDVQNAKAAVRGSKRQLETAMKGVGVSNTVVTELLPSSSSSSSCCSSSSSSSSSFFSEHQNSIRAQCQGRRQGQQASAGGCNEGSRGKQRCCHSVAAKHVFFFFIFFSIFVFFLLQTSEQWTCKMPRLSSRAANVSWRVP